MNRILLSATLFAALLVSSCSEPEVVEAPLPFALTEDAMGRYCGMNVLEHPGPKGQIILQHIPEAIWFSSARDTIAFTMLPEEPRDIAAIYVSDMSKATDWDEPGSDNWVDARNATFVIGSTRMGGMGVEEAVPFSDEADAISFAATYGGQVVSFEDVPQDYILGSGEIDLADPEPEGETVIMNGHDHG